MYFNHGYDIQHICITVGYVYPSVIHTLQLFKFMIILDVNSKIIFQNSLIEYMSEKH